MYNIFCSVWCYCCYCSYIFWGHPLQSTGCSPQGVRSSALRWSQRHLWRDVAAVSLLMVCGDICNLQHFCTKGPEYLLTHWFIHSFIHSFFSWIHLPRKRFQNISSELCESRQEAGSNWRCLMQSVRHAVLSLFLSLAFFPLIFKSNRLKMGKRRSRWLLLLSKEVLRRPLGVSAARIQVTDVRSSNMAASSSNLKSSPGLHEGRAVVVVFAFLREGTIFCCMVIMLRVENPGTLAIRI